MFLFAFFLATGFWWYILRSWGAIRSPISVPVCFNKLPWFLFTWGGISVISMFEFQEYCFQWRNHEWWDLVWFMRARYVALSSVFVAFGSLFSFRTVPSSSFISSYPLLMKFMKFPTTLSSFLRSRSHDSRNSFISNLISRFRSSHTWATFLVINTSEKEKKQKKKQWRLNTAQYWQQQQQ